MTDWESTTSVLARRAPGLAWLPDFVRQRLTPIALSSVILSLAAAMWYVIDAIHDLHRHQESITELRQDRQSDHDLLEKIGTQLAVLDSKIDTIGSEVDRQREWRERIESVAEETPHARRRPHQPR